jgi:hypothetical protein
MAVVVTGLGVLIAAIGLTGVVIPRILIGLVQHWRGSARLWFAVSIRLVLGVVFIAVAPDCRAPMVVRAVGLVSVAAALGMIVLGSAGLDKFINWWLGRPLPYVRLWASGAIAFGALLIYAGP